MAIPVLDPTALFDVEICAGVFSKIEPAGPRACRTNGAPELWPGYVEAHAHLGLAPNFDDSVEDPRVIALQYVFHGITHVIDMFGFPLAQELWERGTRESTLPYPELVHCGYAATSMVDSEGFTGHGVEFPAPVYMLGVHGDLDFAVQANRARGATFLKVMFTDGTEQPGGERRHSRLPTEILEAVAAVMDKYDMPCALDCNTRAEVMQAYEYGFRIFAHSVRDIRLSASDWDMLRGARFVSTLSGLRPMVMHAEDFLREYDRPGFRETQDVANLEAVSALAEPFGIRLGRQESRLAALEVMRENCLAALDRGVLQVGTDCGNLGVYHGYSLLSELEQLAGRDESALARGTELRHAATVGGRRFFDELSGRDGDEQPITVGAAATFNLLQPISSVASLSALPQLTVMKGRVVSRAAIAREITAFRSSSNRGKVIR